MQSLNVDPVRVVPEGDLRVTIYIDGAMRVLGKNIKTGKIYIAGSFGKIFNKKDVKIVYGRAKQEFDKFLAKKKNK